jgi:hypothetical protein
MGPIIDSPYLPGPGPWLRGNLHTHTTESDGNLSPQAAVDAYAALGYDFLMISDHDRITPVGSLDPKGMTLLQGNEITANGPHMLHVNAAAKVEPLPDRQAVIDAVVAMGGMVIMNHPNWEAHFNHCDQRTLEMLQGYTGIEIYNGVTLRAEGSPLATDRWDMLLSQGRRVWGFADDDNHDDVDRGVCWNMVQSASREAGAIREALRLGRFYASTGVVIDEIRVEGLRIRVFTQNAQAIHVHYDHGRMAARVNGTELDFEVPDAASWRYVRIECFGPGASQAWTQPFFLHS